MLKSLVESPYSTRPVIRAFSGHRPVKLDGYSTTAQVTLVRFFTEYLQTINTDVVLSGMALGVDMAAATAACAVGIKFIAVVPFRSQSAVWPPRDRLLYNLLLERAAETVIVCPGEYAAVKLQVRNCWMVDNATTLDYLWDGSVGGTANCVRYARQRDKLGKNLYQDWLEFKRRD